MAEEKLLTIREVSQILNISEKEVVDFAENGSIPAYKVGGVYLRFRRAQIEEFRIRFKSPAQGNSQDNASPKYLFRERLSDFLYFNDFYILAFLIIILIVVIIFNGY